MKNFTKIVTTLALLMVLANCLWAESEIEEGAKNTIGPIIKILKGWVMPMMAFGCALYGVGRGVRRGEWDFTAMCIIAALTLAVLPGIILKLFNVTI